jgi:hypothetical protein
MSIKASIYDFLAYALPGALMLLIILHGLETFGYWNYYSKLIDSNFSNWLVFGVAAYLFGFTVEPLINYITGFYGPDKPAKLRAFESIVQRNPNLKIDLNPVDWAFWFATIRRESLDLAYEIDRLNAQSKMMKGVSCAALLSIFVLACYVVSGKCEWHFLSLILGQLAIAFLSMKQANRFKLMFFLIIFETVISRNFPFTNSEYSHPGKK